MLVFIAAEAREFEGVLRHVEGLEELSLPVDFARRGRLRGKSVAFVANGPGPRLAGRALDFAKELGEVEALVSTGFCGALDPALQPCDIFVATEIISGDRRYPAGAVAASSAAKTGGLLSVDRVASTAEEKKALRETGASAIEMEALAVAERAVAWRIPFHAVRVVSDTASDSFPLDFNQMRDSEGRFSRARIVRAALAHPSAIPKLVELNQRCKRASRALGDFLANVRF